MRSFRKARPKQAMFTILGKSLDSQGLHWKDLIRNTAKVSTPSQTLSYWNLPSSCRMDIPPLMIAAEIMHPLFHA